jgi:hypothetical protein
MITIAYFLNHHQIKKEFVKTMPNVKFKMRLP